MKKFLLAALLVLALSVPALAQDKKSYINGIDANFPPFAFIDSTGKATGFDVEAMNWIADKMGFEVTHQAMPWDGIVASLKGKKIDMISSGLSVTEERAKQIAFSKPYWTIKQVVIASKDSTLTSEEALKGGLKIGVQTGTSDAKAMADLNNKDGRKYELVEYASSALAAQDVANGRIDAAVMNDAPAGDAVQKLGTVKIIGSAGIPDEVFAIGINKDDKELLDIVNQGLDMIMKDEAVWNGLIKKYNPGGIEG